MNYFYSFIFCAVVCALSQLVLEKTKYTPGHMNTILVIIGSILSGFGIYDKIINIFHAGSSVVIMNFGHLLVEGAYEGFIKYGVLGLFKGVLFYASAGISISVISAFIVSVIFKIKH